MSNELNKIELSIKRPDYEQWLDEGIDNGWVSNPFCSTHDLDPCMTDEEEAEWEAGGDPCCVVVKLLKEI